ncbi:hypothetical protein [Demequina globuliformis]|uniref:hypothetical protein n=1 Tax=Demequina globuliformis TaxID=676202 RepID=UPI0007837CFF|nr:hypothetical protein [Demequina globuliformis]
MSKSLWAVNTRGVHAAEIVGVYSSEGLATARAVSLDADSDQWHSFEVVEVVVDEDRDFPELSDHLGTMHPDQKRKPTRVDVFRIGDDEAAQS